MIEVEIDSIIGIPTLSDVIVRHQQDLSLTATRRRDLVSAVDRMSQITGADLGSRPQSKTERIVMSSRLAALGMKLMKGAAGTDEGIADVVSFRDGVMIALLAARPIRRRTFSLIRIGRHLRQIGEEWRLVFDGPETKSGQPLDATIPEQIVPFLKRYLREVRPLIRGAHLHNGLWAGTKGCPLNGQAIYGAIAARTRAEFGHAIGPHLFRHCAATTIAILQPERIGVARDLLGHASLTTTRAHYNKARSIEASRHYAGVLEQLRSIQQRPDRSRRGLHLRR